MPTQLLLLSDRTGGPGWHTIGQEQRQSFSKCSAEASHSVFKEELVCSGSERGHSVFSSSRGLPFRPQPRSQQRGHSVFSNSNDERSGPSCTAERLLPRLDRSCGSQRETGSERPISTALTGGQYKTGHNFNCVCTVTSQSLTTKITPLYLCSIAITMPLCMGDTRASVSLQWHARRQPL